MVHYSTVQDSTVHYLCLNHLSGFIYELFFCLQGHPYVQELERGHSIDVIGCYVMLCCVMLCYAMLCYVMLCYVMLFVMLCYVMLYYVILCYVTLCNVMLCYITLYYILLSHIMLHMYYCGAMSRCQNFI